MKIMPNSLRFISLHLLLLCSCRPSNDLAIFDGNRTFKKYKIIDNEIEIIFQAKILYGQFLMLDILGEIINHNDESVAYNLGNFQIDSKYLQFQEFLCWGSISDSVWTNKNKFTENLIIPPKETCSLEFVYETQNLSDEQRSKLWPWPKDEKIKLNMGNLKIDSTDIVPPTLYLIDK